MILPDCSDSCHRSSAQADLGLCVWWPGNAADGDSGLPGPAAVAPASKLNPFAREFKLNVNAPAFTPTSKPSSSAAALGGAAQPGPGAASAPALPQTQSSGAGSRWVAFAPSPCSRHTSTCASIWDVLCQYLRLAFSIQHLDCTVRLKKAGHLCATWCKA